MSKLIPDSHKQFVKDNYSNIATKEIAAILDRSVHSIYNIAFSLGLKKPDAFYKVPTKDFIERGKKHRFKKGGIPINKGKKVAAATYASMQPTMFKKGRLPHNTKYNGAISKRSDGYLWIRVNLNKWELLHRYVWKQSTGETLNSKDVIRFIDGNTNNVVIDNLYKVDRAGNMDLNSIVRYPNEVRELIHINNKLKRKANGKKQAQ